MPSVSSGVGDPWRSALAGAGAFGLLEIMPGQTRTIELTITPSRAGAKGTKVRGVLYLDDLVPVAGQDGGSEVLGISYAYTRS